MTAPLTVIPNSPAKTSLAIDPRAYQRGLSCVHCGLCLPACPTYVTNGLEADSPRGRIQLMLGLAEGKIEATESVRNHLDLCLDCRGCETACPSGVVYHELLEETRSRLAASQHLSAQGRFMRWIFFNVFTRPTRLKLALLPLRILQKLGIYPLLRKSGIFKLLPERLAKMEQMLPDHGPLWPSAPPMLTQSPQSAFAKKKAVKVGFFTGCIGSVLFDKVNRQAIDLLAACGAKVVVIPNQTCCGAIHHHGGDHSSAHWMALHNVFAFGGGCDYVTTTIAGCGAMLREYDVLLRDDPEYADRAKEFVRRVRDISELLAELGLPPMTHQVNETVTYHDACHLAHAQKVTTAPRQLLAQIPGLKLIPLPESDLCCGAAGTYNLTQPAMATTLAERKLQNIASTGATICAAGNVGCAMQIQSQADAQGQKLLVVHPVELLHRAMFGPR